MTSIQGIRTPMIRRYWVPHQSLIRRGLARHICSQHGRAIHALWGTRGGGCLPGLLRCRSDPVQLPGSQGAQAECRGQAFRQEPFHLPSLPSVPRSREAVEERSR